MEEIIINQIQSVLPQIMAVSKNNKSISFDYDEKADVLYISFKKPQNVTDTDIVNDHILIRKRNNEVVGITILHASKIH